MKLVQLDRENQMTQALVIYGSTTGNTESAAHTIAKVMAANGLKTITKNVSAVGLSDFAQGYEIIVLGCSTWGDDDIELQDDFAEFYEGMDDLDLSGQKLAVFGCGDSSYPHFCGAVDLLEEKLESLGADLVAEGLKIDGDPDDSQDEILDWAAGVAGQAKG